MLTPGVVLLCLLSTCGRPADGDETGGMAAALEASPGIAPRLSVSTPFRGCVDHVPPDGTVPRAQCSAPRRKGASPLTLAGIKPGADDPRSVHLRALLDLTADDPRGIPLDRAISSLRHVVELSDDPTPALVDLSAALIVRAERTQAPRDLLEAYETAQKAADRQPHNPAALYNRALALDRFGLVEEPADDWKTALAADSTSSWAAEARRRLRALQSIHPPVPPRDDAPLADYARYAAEEPQGARELGMDKLLPAWGDAVLRGDRPRADDRLRRAEALGLALLRRPGGDASLADMVRAIRSAAADTVAIRKLAEAHREYGEGRRQHHEMHYAQADTTLSRVAVSASPSSALQHWSQFWIGITSLQQGLGQRGEQLLQAAALLDSTRLPALVGGARWALGRTLGQQDQWEAAIGQLSSSADLLGTAGERESEGAVLSILADARFVVGEADDGYAALHRSSIRLRPYRASIGLHNHMIAVAGIADSDGFLASAVRVLGEDIYIASRLDNPVFEAEARLERTRQLASQGSLAAARADLSRARTLVQRVDGERARAWFTADLQEAEGALLLHDDPARATIVLDSAAEFFNLVPLPFRVLPGWVNSAQSRLAAGDPLGATERLERAFRLLELRRDSIRIEPRRAAIFNAAQETVNRLVMLKLRQAEPADALDYVDAARAALAPAGRAVGGKRPARRVEELAVEYALVADTLLIWTASGSRVQLARSAIDTLAFRRTIQQLEAKLQAQATEAELLPTLSRLHETLVKPVQQFLEPAGRQVVIVADGDIAAVPFAALYDRARRKYLVEDHPLRFSVSLRESERLPSHVGKDAVLLVSDPAFAVDAHPLLDRLRNAHDETARISKFYEDPITLEGASATPEAFESMLSHVSLAHFAGHAVFDDHRPEQSYLVLAHGGDRDDRVTAADLAKLDLANLRLMVLSACRTMSGGHRRGDGFTGLSGALMAAGAGGVVGSTWEVGDDHTAALMPTFHQAYRNTHNAPQALRTAQLALLRSGDGRLRSPAAWAGFRYTGR